MTILSKLVSHNLLASLMLAIIIQPGLASTLLFEELESENSDKIIDVADSPSTLAQTAAAAEETESEGAEELEDTDEETESTADVEDTDDILRIVVTATRTEENILDVPRSVTVIDREQIEQQLQFTNNLPDILGRLVPGLSPPTLQANTRGFTLRGRTAQVLVDGVPQNANSGAVSELNGIAPDVIEQIEIVPGASAIYGDGATGGIINIITRAPVEDGIVYDISAGTRVGLTSVEEDSFGYNLRLGVAAADEKADGRLTFTYDANNAQFDADGDRIPSETGISDSNRLGLLAKLGYDLDEQQRLGLTYSFYRDALESVFASDLSIFEIPGTQTARAGRIGNIDYDAEPELINHIINLTYRNTDVLGSQLDAQLYYLDQESVGTFSDLRPTGLLDIFPLFPEIFQSRNDVSELGARLQVETPLGNSASVLWGADYAQEENEVAALFLDGDGFDDNLQLAIIDEFSLFPKYELDSLGLFAQAKWDITDQWQISGGLRYDDFDFSVDDYELAFPFGASREREGGSGGADDVSFNAGVIYRPVPEVGLFASFSQGFSIPNLGSVFSGADDTFSVDNDLILEPQEVDNFELGVRAELGQVQASLAGFYSESDLGSGIFFNAETGFSELVRAPQRNYGLEAAVDWQPSDTWQLGGYFSWSEGESDADDDGDFLALGSLNVPPYKLGLYVENDTTPRWTNRLQLLAVGDRDRAFDDDVDPFAVDGYVTLDLLSSLQVGKGRLTLGVENLLNNDYLPLTSQERIGGFEERRFAAPGTILSLRYSVNF
ncbi:MAG: TonB-dependent receptor [Cyanobacteria bacterium P01_F01_bin.13]